jgi:hypothetical protein
MPGREQRNENCISLRQTRPMGEVAELGSSRASHVLPRDIAGRELG